MSRLDDCIQIAINAGEVDPNRARLAQERFRELHQRYVDRGLPDDVARVTAGDEVIEAIIDAARSRRHVTLRQMQVMQKNEGRYARAHADDPDLILKDVEHVEREQRAIERSFMAGMRDFLAGHRTDVLGRVRGRAQLKDVVRELHGEKTGNANAASLAQAVSQQFERARGLFNAQGGDIGKLADFGLPHAHHARKIEQAGFARWSDELYERLDWHRIVDYQTGKPFAVAKGAKPHRADADRFMDEVYKGITSRSWDDRYPSMSIGGRALVRRRADHRVLHFKSADDWLDYNEAFGQSNPFEAIVGHLRGMARDIALMRNFGPNPKMGLEHALQVIDKAAATATGPDTTALSRMRDRNARKGKKARVMLSMITGEANQPHDTFWASFLAGTRNLLTAAQLGGAPISQVTDLVSMRIAATAVGLNPNSHTQALIRQFAGGFSPQQAKEMGFVFDTWINTGATMARFMGDVWSPEVTSRVSNFVLRANGLALITDRARVAVAAAFGSDLGAMAGRSFDRLPPEMRTFMRNCGIDAADWDALRDPQALYTDPTGGRHINPEWFLEHTALPRDQAEDIAIRWGALVTDHMEMAVPTTSLRGRATLNPGAPGSIPGELMRSTLMYKSYSLSVMFSQARRVMEMDGAPWTRGLYVAKYVAFMTIMGALAVQLKEVAKGRDPRPMDSHSFWAAALLQGGGIGIFGDFFSASTSRAGGGFAETIGGPVVGVVGDGARAVGSNLARMAEGKDPLIGRDVVNLARRYNPLATYQPLLPVPTRLALDRMVWDELQKLLDPEAADQWRQAEGRMRRDYGTQSFWRRGETMPRRAPDLSNAIGGGG